MSVLLLCLMGLVGMESQPAVVEKPAVVSENGPLEHCVVTVVINGAAGEYRAIPTAGGPEARYAGPQNRTVGQPFWGLYIGPSPGSQN